MIWRGLGFVVVVTAFLSSLVANAIANKLGGPGYWDAHGWPMACSLVFSGCLLWLADMNLARVPGKALIEEETGKRVVLKPKNDFFFMPLKAWSVIFAIIALGIVVSGWKPGSAGPRRSFGAETQWRYQPQR